MQKAKSGHPGTPMDAAPTAYALWQRFLRYDPADPEWMNRDRFVLSCGHASMLLYSLIHLAGIRAVHQSYDGAAADAVTLRRYRNVPPGRQPLPGPSGISAGPRASRPPPGRSAKAWPTSVGMAMAGRWLAATYNRPGFDLFGFNV